MRTETTETTETVTAETTETSETTVSVESRLRAVVRADRLITTVWRKKEHAR